jgi:hypothetical protein
MRRSEYLLFLNKNMHLKNTHINSLLFNTEKSEITYSCHMHQIQYLPTHMHVHITNTFLCSLLFTHNIFPVLILKQHSCSLSLKFSVLLKQQLFICCCWGKIIATFLKYLCQWSHCFSLNIPLHTGKTFLQEPHSVHYQNWRLQHSAVTRVLIRLLLPGLL